MFGVPLLNAAKGNRVPIVVEDCIRRLETLLSENTPETPRMELLFTIDADVGVLVRKIREKYQDGDYLPLSSFDGYTVAGLLLTFFKELPHPLLPFGAEVGQQEQDSLNRLSIYKVCYQFSSSIL